jgi:outer membrane lipoprotein-sorting protein
MRCSPNLTRKTPHPSLFPRGGERVRVWGAFFSLISGLVLLAGCARAPVMPAAPLITSAEELVTLLREREAAVRTLKVQFAVEASGTALKGPQRMEAALVYRRPGTIRLQTFSRMGFAVFDLVLTDGQYHLLFPMQGKSQKGSVAELDHKDALGAPISLGLQATLGSLGGTLLPTDQVVLREENDQYVLDVMGVSDGGNVARRLWFMRSTLEVARQDLFDASGALQATMVYQDYRAVGSTSAGPLTWPTRVQAEDGLGRTKLVLTVHDVIPNPELTSQDWGSVEVGRDQ